LKKAGSGARTRVSAEALRRHEAGLDAVALGEGVDDEGRPVREKRDLVEGDAALAQDVDDAALEVGRFGSVEK
jgi:hypothetical protein